MNNKITAIIILGVAVIIFSYVVLNRRSKVEPTAVDNQSDKQTQTVTRREKFFNEVEKGKGNVAKKQFEEAKKSGKWRTYRDVQLRYEFSFPATWSEPQTNPDAPFTIQYHDYSSQNDDWYTITLGYISEAQLATMGVDYCSVYLNDKRCEKKRIGGVEAIIDWGVAFVKIVHPKGGIITFKLEPNSSEAKSLFIPILNTFKFTE